MSDERLLLQQLEYGPHHAELSAKALARIRELEAELERQRDLGADIAMGRKVIVPVEPTPEMIERGANAGFTATAARASVLHIYRAMIRAAQEKTDETE